jgi:large conductance mechanosensitive channel
MSNIKETSTALKESIAKSAIKTKDAAKSFIKDFFKFISKGNVIELAVALILGTAFTAVVTSMVNDLLTPPIGLLLQDANLQNLYYIIKRPEGLQNQSHSELMLKYPTPKAAQDMKLVTVNYGAFLQALIISFK